MIYYVKIFFNHLSDGGDYKLFLNWKKKKWNYSLLPGIKKWKNMEYEKNESLNKY